jgi:hypothetical protein
MARQLAPPKTCKCGCGTPVTATWVRGHSARGEGGYAGLRPIPGPDDPGLYDDIGELVPDAAPGEPESPVSAGRDAPPVTEPDSGLASGPAPPDEPPAHGARGWGRTAAPARGRGRAPRVTVAVRADIDAKVRFALQVPGAIWQARDPVCGSVFVQQIPGTAEAFADIICDSADLVAFFTGPGGNFMKALKVGAALMPVVQVVMAHHVYHSIEAAEVQADDDMTRYAA